MKSRITAVAVATVFSAVSHAQIDQKKAPEQQVDEALSALPESMREDVTVKGFDESGALVVLREGTSDLECRSDDPAVRSWVVTCYPKSLESFVARGAELTKQGADTPERIKTLKREIEAGELEMPPLAALYLRSGNSVASSSAVTVLHVPNRTARESGLPSLPTRGAPWMAESGTPMANIRIPR